MAVTNTNSTQIGNAVAIPRVPNVPAQDAGMPIKSMAVISMAAGDSNNSTYRFFRVRSGDVVHSLKYATLIGSSTATVIDVGVYDIEGGALVATNGNILFATAIDVHTADKLIWTELLPGNASAVMTAAKCEQRIWELLGLSADPFKEYDVTVTATTAVATAALKLALQIELVR